MIRNVASWARASYDASAPLDEMIDPACLPALWAMTRIYSGLLSIIEKDPDRVVGAKRIRLSSAHKATIALRAAFMARAST
jgi:phytoene/squalene synthetase